MAKQKLTKSQLRAKNLRAHKVRQQIILVFALFGIAAFVVYHIILLGVSVKQNPIKAINQAQHQNH